MVMTQRIRSFLIPILTVGIIFGVAIAIIAYGRGYRVATDGTVNPTGLLVLSSEPSGAQIIIDGKVKTATPATLSLPPGMYDVTIAKDGFQNWQKRLTVQGEVVAKGDALLLPTNPSLTALTASGVVNPILSPDGGKLAYIIPDGLPATASAALATTKPGVWVLDLVDKPLGLNRDARQIAQNNSVNFSRATLTWSPESKQMLVSLSPTSNFLLEADQLNISPRPIVNIKLLQSDWQKIKDQRQKEQFVTVPKLFTDIATSSARVVSFSPDETKILYEATSSATIPEVISPPLIGTNPTTDTRMIDVGNIYIYDVKEDRNYLLGLVSDLLPKPEGAMVKRSAPTPTELARIIHWLPTSRHLVIVGKDKVGIMDFDGGNRRTAYAGPFWDSFAVPWASGGKLVILTNLNSAASLINNLYVVNLK